MATIGTAIEIYDRVSRPINSMIAALGSMCDTLESVDRSMDGTFDSTLIEQTRRKVEETALEVIQLGRDTENTENKQRKYNDAVTHGGSAMDGLISKVGRLIGAYAGIQGLKKALDLSDTMTSTTARLNLLVSGEEKVLELQNDIYEAAMRSRGSYLDMAGAVSKLGLVAGKAFSGTEEMVRFTELLNKNFAVSGASAQESSAAMYQLTQAMGSGRLQGDEFRSIIENAPLLAKSIEDYMVNVQGAKGTMKEWAADGLLTADVIKNALFNSAEEVETKFKDMPLTFAQMGEMAKNYLLRAFEPVMQRLSQIAQSEGFQTFISGITRGLASLANILLNIMNIAGQVANFFSKNWSVIEPIVWGIVTALGAYYGGMVLVNTMNAITALSESVKKAATMMSTGETFAATAAQHGYNAALLACPLTWIVVAIVAVIAVVAMLCSWFAKMTGAASSGFGIICGGVMVVLTFFKNLGLGIANVALGIWNVLGACVHNIYTAFNNVILSVQSMFYSLLSTVLDVVAGIAKALNALPFISFDYSGITKMANDYAKKSADAQGKMGEYESLGEAFNKGMNTFEYVDYGDAFKSGTKWGDGVADSIGNVFGGGNGKDPQNIFDPDQYASTYEASQMPSNIASIAENTGDMKDSMDITKEELKYLRDIAERDTINRFTTAEISVNMTNNNNISSDMDLDGVVDYLVIGVNEAMATAAEGVHV
jgi:tape measure domain-containing protein